MKFYAVVSGRKGPKIYTSWDQCNNDISGFSGAIFKSFTSKEMAENYLKKHNCKIPQDQLNIIKKKGFINNKIENLNPPKKKIFIVKKENPLLKLELSQLKKLFSQDIIVFTDGSCSHQGTTLAKSGSGIYFPVPNIRHSSRVIGKQTNNRAELYAVILAVRFVNEAFLLLNLESKKNLNLEIHLDSTYVINGLENYKNYANKDLWKILKDLLLTSKDHLSLQWIKELAHSGIEGNEIADSLAKVYVFHK